MLIHAYIYAEITVKKKVSVSIDKKIYEKAHSLGVNVSKVSENALLAIIDAIEHANTQKQVFSGGFSAEKSPLAGPLGFEPRTFSLEGWRGTAEDWNHFRAWLKEKRYNRTWESTLYNYAVEYGQCLFSGDLSAVRDLSVSKRPNVLKAISALAKFLGCYEKWKGMVRSYGLKWTGRSKSDIFIDRLERTENSEDIWRWIVDVKREVPRVAGLVDLMAVSGLRFVEGVNSFNLIIQLASAGKLDKYYVAEKKALEHYRFKETFIRDTKKAFVSFVPESLIAGIVGKKFLPEANTIGQRVRRRGFQSRFKDIRKAQGTFMLKYLKEPEIDFLQGRVTASVFMANYFNPALIVDLQSRVFKGVSEIQEKIKT